MIILSSTININKIPHKTTFFMSQKNPNHEIPFLNLSDIKNNSIKTNKQTTRSPFGWRPETGKISITTNRVQPGTFKVFSLVYDELDIVQIQ
jgi:hypothetical protein